MFLISSEFRPATWEKEKKEKKKMRNREDKKIAQ